MQSGWDLLLHYNYPNCDPEFIQAAVKQFESKISDLKNRLKTQENETQQANSKFEISVSAQEKLKKKFEAERKAWADEKAALLSRAEQAEATLTERTAELSGLKRHVSQMVSAIFGKFLISLHHLVPRNISIANSSLDFVMQVPGVPTSTRAC